MISESFFDRLPPYFNVVEKGRLTDMLRQFKEDDSNKIRYDQFYINSDCEYLMQSDFLQPMQCAHWNESKMEYETVYSAAVLLSNSCDLSEDNERGVNIKNAVFAPVIKLSNYIETLKESGKDDALINGFLNSLKLQEFSNLIYFPPFDETREKYGYLVFLDRVFYRPTNSLTDIFSDLSKKRIISLSHFGFYLFLLKTINHFGRLPEERENRSA